MASICAPTRALIFTHSTKRFFPSFKPFSLQCATKTTFILQQPRHNNNNNNNVIQILQQRGLLDSLTSDALRSACSTPLRVYCGFDPTAESLHLGNLLALVVLSWFRRCGHRAVALIGGATARVGDPSGKSLERPELDADSLEKNTLGISNTIERILGGAQNPNLVGSMMAKESVRKRLESEQGMSYTEFTYQLLQGYDFLHLFQNEGVSVQIGGSDQWGNITAGTELIRKILQVEGAYGLTFPLLLKSDGTKFGKSEDGAIWLSPTLLSPYKFYQYFFSVPDADVIRPGSETKLDWKTIEGIAEGLPSCSLAYDEVLNLSLVDLSVSSGLFESKSAARRLLKQGGLYLNNSRVDSESKRIEAADIVDGKVLLLSAGKKNKVLVRIA
uniref:Tyrosine--tRNA ligase n=1 Tax=Cajanus cajan TaxID=3821 RepID=A0A151U0Z2_CAJCA|nr:Tyrosyl-tRNA synthetase [Cajanus cajan]